MFTGLKRQKHTAVLYPYVQCMFIIVTCITRVHVTILCSYNTTNMHIILIFCTYILHVCLRVGLLELEDNFSPSVTLPR